MRKGIVANSPLRVLFVSHTYVVGVNQGKLEAIAQLENVEVALLTPSNWKALEWNRLIPLEKPPANIRTYSSPVLFSGRGGAHLYPLWMLWQVLNDFRPDLVQVEEEVFSLCAFEFAIWSRLTGKPLVVFGWENMDRRLSFVRRWICQFVLSTTRLLLPGNQDGAKIMRQWGYGRLLEVIPQIGVDLDFFASQAKEKGFTQSQISQSSPFHIGFLGRLVHGKGIDLIFTAARQLCDRGLNVRILIYGSGPIETELKEAAREQGIEDWTIWHGALRHENVPQALAQFDVLVLPSRSTPEWKEQFGHVLIEAMAMKIPVIGSSSGEIPHVIGRSDLIFEEENANSLAAILERAIRQPDWKTETGEYGFNRVKKLYTHSKIAERLLYLWQLVLEREVEQSNANYIGKPLT